MDNKVVPDKATRDKIFGVVKALFVGARNGAKTGLKREFTSWPSIIGIWIPVILLVVSLSLGIIYKYDLFGLGKAMWLQVLWIVSVLLMYVFTALSSVVDAFISIRGTINMLPVTTDRAMKTADRNSQHVMAFYEHKSEGLKYVLVHLKAERALWERRISLLVGQIEKIGLFGMIPGVAAAITIRH